MSTEVVLTEVGEKVGTMGEVTFDARINARLSRPSREPFGQSRAGADLVGKPGDRLMAGRKLWIQRQDRGFRTAMVVFQDERDAGRHGGPCGVPMAGLEVTSTELHGC